MALWPSGNLCGSSSTARGVPRLTRGCGTGRRPPGWRLSRRWGRARTVASIWSRCSSGSTNAESAPRCWRAGRLWPGRSSPPDWSTGSLVTSHRSCWGLARRRSATLGCGPSPTSSNWTSPNGRRSDRTCGLPPCPDRERANRMFTGIIEELGEAVRLDWRGDSAVLSVRGPKVAADAQHGDSISVNGVCLTVVETTGETFTVDVMKETLDRTTLGRVAPGDPVNLERAATLATRLGGHVVQGHVDGVGVILSRFPTDRWHEVRI